LFVIFAEKHQLTKVIVNIVGGSLITVFAIAASYIPFPTEIIVDKVIIGSILPLVPGVAFTNAIRDIANSDFISGTVRMIDSMLVFVYIAIGVGFVLATYTSILGGLHL
ncbi:MAG: threonine/serine exporter family protein, partial [Lachnospiraceae bacterium]